MIELASILVLGIFAQWLAWRIKQPAILPLILIGLLVGPVSTFFTPSGEKLIDGDAIFKGDILFAFVSLSVGIILFEGGLTLKVKEIRHLAKTVRNLLTIGAAITFVGGTAACYFLLGLDLQISMLFGALIIVTGPTVIAPILRNIRATKNIDTVLKWEGILIDPVGALVAVLIYEFIRSQEPGGEYTIIFFKDFFFTIIVGVGVGSAMAFVLYFLIKKRLLPKYLKNIAALAIVVGAFALADAIMHESGLLAVTVMGMILANLRLEELRNILSFKEDVSVILISLLFIILSSRITIEDVSSLGVNSLVLFLVVILVLRPLTVFLSTINSNLSLKEKIFISWIGPRGIVAAAVASLFSLEIINDPSVSLAEREDAALLLPLTFMIIVGTVILQGGSAKLVLKWLKLERREPQGIVFVGANEAARFIASYLKQQNVPVILADTSHVNIVESKAKGLPVFEGSILSDDALEDLEIADKGRLFAMTSNTEINGLANKRFRDEFGENNVFRLISQREMQFKELIKPKNLLFGPNVDFIHLVQKVRKRPQIKELPLAANLDLPLFLSRNRKIIPFFVRTKDNKFHVVSGQPLEVQEGDRLVYIGELETEEMPLKKTPAEAENRT